MVLGMAQPEIRGLRGVEDMKHEDFEVEKTDPARVTPSPQKTILTHFLQDNYHSRVGSQFMGHTKVLAPKTQTSKYFRR